MRDCLNKIHIADEIIVFQILYKKFFTSTLHAESNHEK